MTFKLFDAVTSVVTLPDQGIKSGLVGTVVDVYSDGDCEVEFCDNDGYTFALLSMSPTQITPYLELKKAA